MTPPDSADVVVVGAGLAGLAATLHLTRAGVDVHLVEAGDRIGGRVATDTVDGFTIDRGFQVIATSYPELGRLLNLADLDLQPFVRGLGIYGGGRVHRLIDPRRDPRALAAAARAPLGSLADRAQLLAYALSLIATDASDVVQIDDAPAIEAFREQGLSDKSINRVLRPFLRGVVLEDDLSTSRRFVDLALRSMLTGLVAVPAKGMRALPLALAAHIPAEQVSTAVSVNRIDDQGVHTDSGLIRAAKVVVATDAPAAHRLVPDLPHVPMRSVTTVYHAADAAPRPDGLLLVDGEQHLIANTVVLSEVAPTYSPDGRSLIATSVLGHGYNDDDLDARLRPRLSTLYDTDARPWSRVAIRQVANAVPAMPAPHDFRRPVRIGAGRYLAGDHRDSGSLQGALVSGRRAATAVCTDLGLGLPEDSADAHGR